MGGHKLIKMTDLKKAFESLGFQKVETLLASGNVVFDAPKVGTGTLTKKIEEGLKKELGQEIGVLVRTIEEIKSLIKVNPLKKIKVKPLTRLYVTFLSEKPKGKLKMPLESPEKDYRIVRVSPSEVCSVITLSPGKNTTDLMKVLEKEYGKKITTRNWNTVRKIAVL